MLFCEVFLTEIPGEYKDHSGYCTRHYMADFRACISRWKGVEEDV